jgi:hypothetical protein
MVQKHTVFVIACPAGVVKVEEGEVKGFRFQVSGVRVQASRRPEKRPV